MRNSPRGLTPGAKNRPRKWRNGLNMNRVRLAPGSRVGIVGGGQLGRMLALAGARLGLSCHIYTPQEGEPAAEVCATTTVAAYDDAEALAHFAANVDVITYEFENIPARATEILAALKPVRPKPSVLALTQDR